MEVEEEEEEEVEEGTFDFCCVCNQFEFMTGTELKIDG